MPSPRKSNEQHKIEGTFRPARHGKASTAPPTKGVPQPPKNMSADERAVWDEVVEQTTKLGTAGEADSLALFELVRWTLRLRLLHNKSVLHSKDTTALASAWKCWWTLANQFGIAGKLSRDKLAISDGPDKAEQAEAYLDYFREPEKRQSQYEFIPDPEFLREFCQ